MLLNYSSNIVHSSEPSRDKLSRSRGVVKFMIYIFLALELIAIVVISMWLIGPLLKMFRNRVNKHLENTDFKAGKEVFSKSSIELVDDKLEEKRRYAIIQAILIGDRAKGLNWITTFIALVEAVVFSVITYLLFRNGFNTDVQLLAGLKVFGSFLGGWLAIKILSSHQAWSDAFAGKAYYYISLLGTILNIFIGSLAGYIFYLFCLRI